MLEVTSSPPTMDSKVSLPQQGQSVQKKRKLGHEKVVVTVKVEGSSSSNTNQKNEGPPSDPWSWRKYGQKPIKGSPYPRGYYRCSTSKGCSAKKQVERCRTDPSLLIITYTSNHSHADPADLENASNQFMETSCRSRTSTGAPSPKQAEEPETTEKKKEERNDNNEDEHFRYCLQSSPLYGSKEDNPFSEDMETTYDSRSFRVNENSKKYCPSYNPHHLTTISADLQNSEENNDFYDELEELPTSSFFSSFMRRNFFEERILVNPS